MMEKKLYKDYFNIDPKYYAAVTAELINEGKVSWKGFYPHDTFVKLLQTTYKVLSGAASRSIWVEGAYGTGKSHAALTIKSLIEATDAEVIDYFNDYGLNKDLRDKFISMKNSGKIITIHRIGSAGIHTDTDLILAVQQSVMAALKAHGIENKGEASMKDAFLKWLEKAGSKTYFNELISQEQYAWTFSGVKVDDIIEKLKTGTDLQIENIMRDIMTVLKDAGQYGLFQDVTDMAGWIKSIIQNNDLSAILFIWDEFSEYFLTHPVGLTGFQTLAEISLSHPFYFMIVAHESRNLFSDADTAKKTLDRFEPSIKIELPENMAFRLMSQAMKTTSDPVLSKQWIEDYAPALNNELINVRNTIAEIAKRKSRLGEKTVISDKDLQSIVPIHPYAALLLKHIATVFNSNQRSMFDFIISNDMEEAKGFKWYINTYGIMDTKNNLLTIDLLWDFFCGKEQNGLNDDVRGVLDSYRLLRSDKLVDEEQRVLKTLLLLQAISLRVTGNELLVPNDQNLDLAFEGLLDWHKGKAIAIANGLCAKNLIFKKPVAGGKFEYCGASGGTAETIEPYRKKVIDETKTQDLIVSANLLEAVSVPVAFKERYVIEATGAAGFTQTVAKLNDKSITERFKVIVTFAMNDIESAQIKQHISKAINNPQNGIIFIETLTPMGKDLYDQYVETMAFSKYNISKDKSQAAHYEKQAISVLKDWQSKISDGAFVLYDQNNKVGSRKANLQDLQEALRLINHQKYYYGLEQYQLNYTMYSAYQLANGAYYGITQTLSGAYSNKNKNMSFEKALEGAWGVEKYWEKPDMQSSSIVHIKKRVDQIIQNGFNSGAGIVSMSSILDEMEKEPFGFMPSSVTALVLGFVMKEYAVSDYYWSNGSNSEIMTIEKMKTMIGNALQQRINHNKNYKEEFIRSMTPEVRNFLNCTIRVFKISATNCGSVEDARDQIRIKMKELSFPIWCIKYILDAQQISTPVSILNEIIDCYTGIANTANSQQGTENKLAERIGQLVMECHTIMDDLEVLITNAYCQKGMVAYIKEYKDGVLLQLAEAICDNGIYLEQVKKKFDANEANWVWNQDTVDEKISDVILEYKIIVESNKSLQKCTTLKETISVWNTRTNYIYMPCDIVMKYVGDLAPFLEQLKLIKQNGTIAEHNKQKFYDLLLTQRESFDSFYKNQVQYFAQDAEAFLGDLEKDEIAELYDALPCGQFTKSKSEYYQLVQTRVNEYIQKQWKKKIHDLWFAKTGSKDPVKWSEDNMVPILCLFDNNERTRVKTVFNTMKSAKPSEVEAQEAIKYLESADFYNRLKDVSYQEKCFRERILGRYAILLQDIPLIKNELVNNVQDCVYDWMDNRTVQDVLRKMADKQYKLTGCDQAIEVIDKMDSEQLRRYLKNRISDDVDFGMMILKGE